MTQRQLFLKHLAPTSQTPLAIEIEKAKGVWLYRAASDTGGGASERLLDLISGIGVSSLGHRHPRVVAAIKQQADRYLHTMVYGEFVLSPQIELAQALVNVLPPSLDSVYLTNSGAEAVEAAMKLAKRVTRRTEFVAMRNAYHGSTQGAMSLNSDDYFTQNYRPLLPDVQHLTFDCEFCLQRITTKTAAVIVETVQAEAGIVPPSPSYFKAVKKRCEEVGALLILDEIQVGMGRTGTFFAFEQEEIVPDILVLAKGLGGGMPIGAMIAPQSLTKYFADQPILGHITTFGGHPVSAAAAAATVRVLTESNLIEKVKEKEILFLKLLKHRQIRAVRSRGLFIGVELENFEILWKVIERCIEKGVLTDWFLFNNRTMRIAPPLTISTAEIRFACKIILETLDEI